MKVNFIYVLIITFLILILINRLNIFDRFKKQSNIIIQLREYAATIKEYLLKKKLLKPKNEKLLRKFSINSIYESKESETINKATIFICTNKKNENISDRDNFEVIKFAFLHELGHVISVEYGHGPEFWENFQLLLIVAEELNIIDKFLLYKLLDSNTFYCEHTLSRQYLP